MREIYKGYIIPDYIVTRVEIPTLGSKPVFRLMFRKDFDYKSREFLNYCMTERDFGANNGIREDGTKSALRVFFESTTFVMNVFEDPENPKRWTGGRFTPEQYLDLVNRCEDLGYRERFYRELNLKVPNLGKRYVAQYGKPKWPTGGGRNAQAAGKFFYADRDITSELYRTVLNVDVSKMNPRERVSRTAILYGNYKRFNVPPRIVFADFETGGTAMVDSEYAEREGLKFGDKLWPTKASAVVSKLHIEGADMVIPKDAIKFKEHNDVRVLAPLMGCVPELSAEARSSVEKERLPKMALDTMQWLYPELQSMLDSDPRLKDSLGLVRRVVEGSATIEEMVSLAEYPGPDGKPAYPRAFHYLLNGHPKEDKVVRDAVMQVAGTAAMKALCFKTKGRYGVAMPLTSESAELTLLMPPWMLPFRAHGSYAVDNVIGVESDWAIGCLGKDYDGDLAMSLELGAVLKRIGLDTSVFPSWHEEEDRAWAKAFMALPKKLKEATDRSVHQVMADGIKSYGLIGIATNMCMVVIDTMRSTRLYTRRQLMGVYLRMMSTEVQPFVDALKYDPKDLKPPVLETKYDKHGKVKQLGLAERYAINWETGAPLPGIERLACKVQAYFRAVRSMKWDALVELPEDNELSGSFYYQLSRLFNGWKLFPEVDLTTQVNGIAKQYPIKRSLESKRSRSFPMFKGMKDALGKPVSPEVLCAKRWEFLEDEVPTAEIALGLVASAWQNKDTRFALWVSQRCGVSVITGVTAVEPVVA
jgi:hypothetical protein